MRIRRALIVGALMVALTPATAWGGSERAERRHEADRCKAGGWETLTRDDASAFRNQGQCVSYAQAGGVLTEPAPEPPPPPPVCDPAVESGFGDADWRLLAHISDSGGMFDGDTDLVATASFNAGAATPTPDPSHPDFQVSDTLSVNDIMFVTGDGSVWAIADYAALRAVIDARGEVFTPNLCFLTDTGITQGNVLSRSANPEDPWITIDGDHFDGIANDKIVWGENDWWDGVDGTSGHLDLKNGHGGINVYVHS